MDEDIMHIWKELERFFGPSQVPNPVNYPETFKWYLTLYKEYKNDND